jgi:hypothetical protein
MLQRGDSVPHFEVRTVDGDLFEYSAIWQRKNLLLVRLRHASNDDSAYMSDLRGRAAEFHALESECVITRDDVPGLDAPGLLIADRWGEIIHITAASESAQSPTPEELLGWLEYVQHRCPECEGEAK